MEAITLSYDDAVTKIEEEWVGHVIDVNTWQLDGTLEASFAGRLIAIRAYDEADSPSAALDLDTGTLVIDRDAFERAEFEEVPTGLRPITRTMELTVGARIIAIHDP